MENRFSKMAGLVGAWRQWPQRIWRSWQRGAAILGLAVLVGIGGVSCSLDGLLNSDELPANVSDPAVTETPEGAKAAYHGTLAAFYAAFGDHSFAISSYPFVALTGMLSDELNLPAIDQSVNRRAMPEGGHNITDNGYSALQKVRGQARQAIGLLTRYLPDQPVLAGHLYAVQGYAELFLAELFCSGIPLSTIDFEGDFTYRPGSTTSEVLAHAIAMFDTARTLAEDSARIVDLARMGEARALLGLGQYADAANVVASILDSYRYDAPYNNVPSGSATASARNFAEVGSSWGFGVGDIEGSNGLNYRTSGDPRTLVTQRGLASINGVQTPKYHPDKYAIDGSSPIAIASGVEARLIQAEAELQSGSSMWLAMLNALRTDGTFEIVDSQAVTDTMVDATVTPPDTTIDTTSWTYDTLWHAGSGGYDGLAPLADPGTADGRVDLLFRERAFWLFLTGQRQGDLRRLIRQYGRVESEVYPVGPYVGGGAYGPDVTAPIPTAELANPLYTGCASRGA